jgi:hypothetical protein
MYAKSNNLEQSKILYKSKTERGFADLLNR